ncbi:SusC/RagA family TonB-linked outer membrane protein [Parabacteroides sp. AM58-2XD]|uniref:SusC/RagA family TonB-linked outer membrane protein n=2 Tax=Parabacteroides TaxID=375288 RepID=UPI001F21332D|nr:SusC/RagA family TonB-linked outer membrane protein [Parabacteroides sp. AM58-2XD]
MGALCLSNSMYAETHPLKQSATISQQNGKVTGVVEDEFGPVAGASVVVKGTTNGNITDMDGNFTLEGVKKGDIIQISFVGFTTQEIKYTGQPSINVKLAEDSQALEEVVVTGYGGIQKAKTLTASAVTVKMESIAKLPVTSISDGLGGRVTGVTTQSGSGAPGETTKIWIRGGSEILYVIDDVVMETTEGEIFFNRLRPDDIASMTILKDASATAIYGPRAADGVVVIATKKGVSGQLDITFNQKVSIMTPSYRPKGMNSYEYAQTMNELYAANYEENPKFNNTQMSKYYMGYLNQQGKNREEIMNLVNEKYNMGYSMQDINDLFNPFVTQGGNIEDYYQTYDPWEFFNHVQPMYQTNLSVRGGGDRIKYYSSLGYLNQKGISDTYGYEQINALLNSEASLLNDKSLKFTLNLNGIVSTKERPAEGDNIFNKVLFEGGEMLNKPERWSTGLERSDSPASLLRTGFNNTYDYRLQANMGLKWNLPWVEGLSVGASVNFSTSYTMNKKFNHPQEEVYSNPASTMPNNYNALDANVYQKWSNYLLTTGIYQADYNRSFGKHTVSAMVTYQSQVRNTNYTNITMKGYPTTFVPQIGAGTKYDNSDGGEVKWGSSSWVGRVTYDYAGKYLLQYSANYNASLSYNPDKRWGFFQAVSGGWVMTEETFFKELINPNILNMFKLRLSYGIVGGEVGDPFSYMNQYKQDGAILLGSNMTSNAAWVEANVASDLSWTRSRQLSAGVDFDMFKNRLNGSFDTYLYMNHGAAMNMNQKLVYTPILGMPNTPQINAPFETSRKGGIEFSLNWNDKIGDFNYRLGVNYSYWDERVTRHQSESTNWYYPKLNSLGLRNMQNTYGSTMISGGLFGTYDQLYNSVLDNGSSNSYNMSYNLGAMKLEDRNGDGIIDNGDRYWVNKAGTTPLTLYGITLGGGWKGLDIEIFLQGAANVTGSMPSPLRSQQSYLWNYGKYLFNSSYLPSNPDLNANLPLPNNGSTKMSYGSTFVDRWVYNASYLKMKNISVRYDLKRDLLKNVSYIKGLDVSFIITNAFTWVNKNYPLKNMADPEYIPVESIWGSSGKLGAYPTQRSYTFGVTVTL